jgi:intracellular sulfur oxidation DsrE/DsrF family protein
MSASVGRAARHHTSNQRKEDAMHRRNILWGALSAFGAAFAASRAGAATEAAPAGKLKVVYHLSDLDKVSFVLGNIQNHLDGVGGPDHVTIALVVHGPALRAFHAAQANPDLTRRVGQFSRAGIELAACGNTMKSQNVTLGDLLPGFVSADRGGVVRLAELQSLGFLYLRP